MAQAPYVSFEYQAGAPTRALTGAFNKAEEELLEIRREELRPEGQRFVTLAQEEAPKRSGEFAAGIRWRSFIDGNAVGFRVTTPQPLGRWIQEGTQAHDIPLSPGKALRFFWEGGPQGPGIYFFMSVRHPGTDPNRFMGRAYRAWLPGARGTLRKIGLRYIRTLRDEIRRGKI